MNIPIITWGCTVGLFVLIPVIQFFRTLAPCTKGKLHFIEIGSEREEFFIPGDPNPQNTEEYDYDDFD